MGLFRKKVNGYVIKQGVKPVTQRTVLKVCQLRSVSQGLRAKNRVVPVVGRVGLEPTTTEL